MPHPPTLRYRCAPYFRGVWVGVGVRVGSVRRRVAVGVRVRVGVLVGVLVGVAVRSVRGVLVGVAVAVFASPGVFVDVGVVGVLSEPGVRVAVAVPDVDGVVVGVGVIVGVPVGGGGGGNGAVGPPGVTLPVADKANASTPPASAAKPLPADTVTESDPPAGGEALTL
jgi:hypothetical protein